MKRKPKQKDLKMDFKDELGQFIKAKIDQYGVGIVSAECMNITADMLCQCDDEAFKQDAINTFSRDVLR